MAYMIVYCKEFKTQAQAKKELHKIFDYSQRDLFSIVDNEIIEGDWEEE